MCSSDLNRLSCSFVGNLGGDNLGNLLWIVKSLSEQDNSTQFTAWVTRIPCGDNPRRQSNSGYMNFDQKVERMSDFRISVLETESSNL